MSNLNYKPQFGENQTYVIKINTNFPGDQYWIKLRRNNQYMPYKNQQKKNPMRTGDGPADDVWTTVHSKKKEKPIYYWVVDSHNLFDRRNKSYKLFFTEPDSTQIENMDQTNYMAIDNDGQLRLLHAQLKHDGMKMNPTFYIARNIKQIEECLKYVKYCVVKVENNEQKLVEDPSILQIE
jgi:hypothetical protein